MNLISQVQYHNVYSSQVSVHPFLHSDYHWLERCERIRDIGVILGDKITFAQHVDEMVRTVNRMLGLFIWSMQTAPRALGARFDHCTVMTAYIAHLRLSLSTPASYGLVPP